MVSDYYSDLHLDEVVTVYKLIKFLRRLRVIGILECHTTKTSPVQLNPLKDDFDFSSLHSYGIEKVSYISDKNRQDAEELLEQMFGRISISYRGTQ